MCVWIMNTNHFLCGHSTLTRAFSMKTGCWFTCNVITAEVVGQGVHNWSKPCTSCISAGTYWKRGTRWYHRA
ncbi:hypothetical protein BFJ69_g1331 [Fusarium oxysporum]|uniref:Uncharacterized protein n=1 Tax=Fusarium oxysporum TaxID=5507 RepID=A0A420NZK6_FUSOX|nr:hypothetical protein BFJ69_g1331 [Fusarium oxysporum]